MLWMGRRWRWYKILVALKQLGKKLGRKRQL
jgi:hypothetical protein